MNKEMHMLSEHKSYRIQIILNGKDLLSLNTGELKAMLITTMEIKF
jgi:hypothetical protein